MLYIKGFKRRKDGKLYCYDGTQFEIGKEYKIDSTEVSLCSDTVFIFSKTLKDVHWRYNVRDTDSVFCYVEALGEVVEEYTKCSSNHIKILRELTKQEFDNLTGLDLNNGMFNEGKNNIGDNNEGDNNMGNDNKGNDNKGNNNEGYCNIGNDNIGNDNMGNDNEGDNNIGRYNKGNENKGDSNIGNCNIGHNNEGEANIGHNNKGNFNMGNFNIGNFNICNNAKGFFCTKPSSGESNTIQIFDVLTDMALTEFENSRFYKALHSIPFSRIGWNFCVSKTQMYQEVCNDWWKMITDKNKAIIMQMPNFNKEKFFEITGIEV